MGDFGAGTNFDSAYSRLPQGSSFGLGVRFGSYTLGEGAQNGFTLPISYSYTFANYDRLIMRAPITYMDVDGAVSYSGNLGVGYRKNISSRWSLTPALGYGITGSADIGSLAHIFSASVTSDLLLYKDSRFSASMGNLVTVISERLMADLDLFIEPALEPSYQQHLRLCGSATIGRMEGGRAAPARRTYLAPPCQTEPGRNASSRCLTIGDLIELGNIRLLVHAIEHL